MKNQIYTCLWYDGNAKAAADFYCSVFKNSRITTDSPMVVNFEINGTKIMGLNGGSQFKFNESISMVVECEDQAEIDYYWDKLTGDGGHEVQCGWLTDKFGLSWQIIPSIIGQLMTDPTRSERVMAAVMPMKKIIIEKLVNA